MSSRSKKLPSTRVFGQRSIASTFCSFQPYPCDDSERNARNQASRNSKSKSACVSLSHFLDRKLQKCSVFPQKVQGKSMPFQSPLGLRTPVGGQVGPVKQVEEERCGASDKVIFETFKHTDEEMENVAGPTPICDDELENSVADDNQESRKRKNPFEGGNESQTVRNNVVVLGGEPKFKQKGQFENDSSNKKSRPPYNHYANGRGWWDHDMEGVDNEALGSTEVWEGVGTTTLGGLVDWH